MAILQINHPLSASKSALKASMATILPTTVWILAQRIHPILEIPNPECVSCIAMKESLLIPIIIVNVKESVLVTWTPMLKMIQMNACQLV